MDSKYFFDFDDSLFYTKKAIFDYVNTTYGLTLDINKWHCGNSMVEVINNHAQKTLVAHDTFWEDYAKNFLTSFEWHEEVTPMPGMVEVIRELSRNNKLYIVTARQTASMPTIKFLVDKHIKDCITGIHCVNGKKNGVYTPVHKTAYVARHGGNKVAFIDDNPREIYAMQKIVPSYLFDPHQLHNDITDMEKFFSWNEIGKKFL